MSDFLLSSKFWSNFESINKKGSRTMCLPIGIIRTNTDFLFPTSFTELISFLQPRLVIASDCFAQLYLFLDNEVIPLFFKDYWTINNTQDPYSMRLVDLLIANYSLLTEPRLLKHLPHILCITVVPRDA